MNTDKVREQFDKFEQVDVMWGGKIKYSNKRNEYYCPNSYWAQDTRDLNQRWEGHQRAYQQATKESDLASAQLDYNFDAQKAEITRLEAEIRNLASFLHSISYQTDNKAIRHQIDIALEPYRALKEANHHV